MFNQATYTEYEYSQYMTWKSLMSQERPQRRKSFYANYLRLQGDTFAAYADTKRAFLKVEKALKLQVEEIEAAYRRGRPPPSPEFTKPR